ncbi:exonuclease domain-containing protein [Stomatohabitans albus]|uniref:exonuclease domain-containing protein n=1 Tax=Stomatohabitans albus TaxID=3110766 RepID=UPI00300CE3D9
MESFVALDFETANRVRASACAIGLVRFDHNGEVEDSLYTLLKPHPDYAVFEYGNMQVHGILPEQVEHAPTWEDIFPAVADFIGDIPVVAHNMAFDGYILSDLAALYDHDPIMNRRYCTLRLARKLLDHAMRKNLAQVFNYYYPDRAFTHHHAGEDALAAGMIFSRMQAEHSIEVLAKLCPPTGKHIHS